MSGLEGEGLLYFGVRGNEEMKKNQPWQNERQKNVWTCRQYHPITFSNCPGLLPIDFILEE